MPLDVLPGCAQLAVATDAAADEDRFDGVSEGELIGVVCAWDRVEAHAAARKLAAIAELARRNPAPEDAEFTAEQVAYALGESRTRGYDLMGTAGHLDSHLPGIRSALREGIVSLGKARIIVAATALLDPDEAAAAEAGVLDRAGRLTPGGLRAAIARAVIKAAPKKAKERRETLAKFARVERWLEESGNAALMGRELPPDEVLAIDDRTTAWARELKNAGLDGGTDELRARAYLDLLSGKDSRPGQDQPSAPAPAPAGFAGRVTLTVPLATLAGLADRPGELGSLGPVDPWLARDLATAAARNPKTTWCVTATDATGHAIGHGCARPESRSHGKRAGPGPPPGGTGFTFTPGGRDGPPEGHGTWRLRTPDGGPDLIITLDPLTTDPCDHGSKAGVTTPGSDCGTCPRSGTRAAPARFADDPPGPATLSTTPRTKRADEPACVMAARSVATTIGSSSTPSGRSTSSPTAPSAGPPRPDVPTPPNPRDTPYEKPKALPKNARQPSGSGRAASGPSGP
jgi:hypothetical protein